MCVCTADRLRRRHCADDGVQRHDALRRTHTGARRRHRAAKHASHTAQCRGGAQPRTQGPTTFNVSYTCVMCYQMDPAAYTCAPVTGCASTASYNWCTANDTVFCLGARAAERPRKPRGRPHSRPSACRTLTTRHAHARTHGGGGGGGDGLPGVGRLGPRAFNKFVPCSWTDGVRWSTALALRCGSDRACVQQTQHARD